MTDAPRFTLHHAPRSRSRRILWLMEETGVPFAIAPHDLSKATHKDPAYLALNPAGKVPALVDRGPAGDWSPGVVVTESAAICAYVADALPESGLAPAVGSPERAAYATWLGYCPSVLEPAFADAVFPRGVEAPPSALGWPSFALALERVEKALQAGGPYLLGARFSAADVLIGSLLQWLQAWGKLPDSATISAYLALLATRPAAQRARARDEAATAA
ncbi:MULTISPECIES: glutathione S-transferase family protein [Inquilinus]|uniref:Glutathione S-transferase n=1 Tax=Inquilinus ginsengisoli TaxID=363840 RepID=A0ABU1JZR7_9PROT|nr:glutathione S-transferase family protein [Inquilinus ginsengisoli]MDR6294115.1 glutathione S-transferase [Inquilinus ginsengisoli]